MQAQKHVFENTVNRKSFASTFTIVKFIAFGMSIGTTYAMYYALVNGKLPDIYNLNYVALVVLFIACAAGDFLGVGRAGRFYISERLAMGTGRARSSSPEMMPKLVRVAGVVFWLFMLHSAFSSIFGGVWAADFIKKETPPFTSKLAMLEQQKADALQPLQARLDDVQSEISRQIKDKTAGLKADLEKNNAWAKDKYDEIAAGVRKKNKTDLDNAQTAFDKEQDHQNGVIETALAAEKQYYEDLKKGNESKTTSTQILFGFLGFLGLALGVGITYAEAANDVAELLPPLTDAEARALEKEREQLARTGWIAAIANKVRSWSETPAGEPAHDNKQQTATGGGGAGKALF